MNCALIKFEREVSVEYTSVWLTVISSSFIQGQSSKDVTIQLVTNGPKIPEAGSRVEFICTGRESQQVFYQWYKDGQELQGQDNSSLILDPLKVQDFGFYKCEVRSDRRYDSSCVESNVVDLDVTPAEGKSELIFDCPESHCN